MLCQFTFKNFMSYKNETIFDMQAVSSQGFTDSLLKNGDDNKEFLPVLVIYGANAGGKSNVLKALNCVNALVMKPIDIFLNKSISKATVEWTPFLFDNTSRNEPTEFELFFRSDNEYEYKYILKVTDEKISEEYLYRRKLSLKSRIATIFERNTNGIKLGASINKASINTEVNDQMPYLSFLYINYKFEPIIRAVNWFKKCIMLDCSVSATQNCLFSLI